ncbi:unnamed protein product [Cyprideis torosa]|uniref:Uncharacterized protein n=1 Tax=Cyprideis torosa TaxID=163714 RepID=A0A7R8W4Z3_9CRUS|nr:unnamed protein product [Cyprideis torosa]CAG0880035.1 unnamed protein product [Cyprideis torosa]
MTPYRVFLGVSEGPGDSDDSGLGGGGSGSHGGGGKGMGRSGSSGMGGSTSVSGAKSFEGTSVEGSNQEPVQTRKASMKEPSFGKEKHHSDRHRNHKRNGDKERKRKETRTTSLEDYIHQAKRRTIPAHILASDEAFMKWLPPSALPPRHHRETKYPRAPRVDWDDIQHGPLVLLLDHKVVTGPVVSDDLSRKRKAAELVHGDAFLPTKMATPSPSSPYAGEHMNGLVYQKGRGSNGHVNLPSTAKLNGNHHMLPPLRLQQVNGFDHQDPSYKRSSLPGTPHSAGTPLSASIKDGDRHGEFFAALNTPAEAYIKKKKKKTRSGGEKDIQKRGGGRPNKVRTTTPAAIVS